MAKAPKNLVIVGDSYCGKSCLLITFSQNFYFEEYIPTSLDNLIVDMEIKRKPVVLHVWDTSGETFWPLTSL